MKLFLEYGVSPELVKSIQELCDASNMRDIELQGNPIVIVRDDYTYIDDEIGNVYNYASKETGTMLSVYRAVMKIVTGENKVNRSNYKSTIFGALYEV